MKAERQTQIARLLHCRLQIASVGDMKDMMSKKHSFQPIQRKFHTVHRMIWAQGGVPWFWARFHTAVDLYSLDV